MEVNADGALAIVRAGDVPKLVQKVEHVTFSGAQAQEDGQEVIYVTERAVFRLGADAVELVEVARGVDLEQDVLARMAFRPAIRLKHVA